tara:strand:+ start:537 stop:1037 length:501 start_codon:yes stop_codon:yes gene_type:complete
MKYFIHPTSILDKNIKIGSNTKIWHWCHLSKDVVIGKNCTFGQNIFIGEGVKIGNNVKIQNNVSIFKGVIIENDVFIGPSVVFTNVIIPRSFINQKKNFKKTIIKKGSTIGANSTIICGNNIGKYSFVGAGSLLTKSIGDNEIGFGIPYKKKGKISKSGKIKYENK